MKTIIIKRIAQNNDGVFGVMIDFTAVGEVPFAVTVEPEDKDNQSNISCIPSGQYTAYLRKAKDSRRTYDIWELEDVPNRGNIQIHKGVSEDSSLGCIIVGESFNPYKQKTVGVMGSTQGYTELIARTEGHEKILVVIQEKY